MRAYLVVSGSVFGIVALVHILRLAERWLIQIEGWTVPVWLSWLGLAVAGGLCIWAFRLAMRTGPSAIPPKL